MVYKRSSLRYAHTTGYTSLIYTTDGDYIITCGSDGDIRRWSGIDDDDPTSNCLGEFVNCIAYTEQRLLASTDCNTVQAYTFPEIDNDSTLMRFTAPVTCLRADATYVAAGSEDMDIKVQKGGDMQSEVQLQGHKGPVLALDVCSKSGLLASIAGDGHLKIWNLDSSTEIKSIAGMTKVNSFESAVCFGTPAFEPRKGDSLAYVKGKEIFVLNTATWEVQFTLSDERAAGEYTCCQFSNDGQFLAAGTKLGELSVYDFVRKQAVKCEPPSSECHAITCIAWHPKHNNELAFCDATGQLGTLFATEDAVAGDAAIEENVQIDFGDIGFEKDDVSLEEDDNSEDDGVSIEKLKSKIMKSAYANGELNVDDDTKDSMPRSSHGSEAAIVNERPFFKLFKLQSPFQPSSTPIDFEHRYLVWNNIGIVTAHADSADGSIDVEFHDASVHHSLHIANYNNHNMASLSSSVLALTAAGATKLVCIALAATGNKELSVQMPDCESVEALAASTKLIAVATNMHFVRLFTVMGTQREIISIPGPVLAIAGHDNRFIVCYHSAPANETQQHISAMLLHSNGLNLRVQQIAVPLTPGRQMTWLGFSDCGSPAFADTMGLVQLFSLKSNCWYPICDTMKQSQSVSNNYFIIDILERNQIVQAVLCRGSRYPATNPRPMLQELSMHLPLCDAETEKSELEDALLRATIMGTDNADKIIKETAIKLFALACRSEIEMRAKELIETIACKELLTLAVKYATKLGRIHLSDRLSELMVQLEDRQSNQNEAETFPINEITLAHTPGKNSSTTSSTKLAPRAMELSSARRAAYKRMLQNNYSSKPSTPEQVSKSQCSDSSECIMATPEYSENTESTHSVIKSSVTATKEITRTPLNSVNPFASKRKLSDVEFGQNGLTFGSAKLKLVKK